MDPANASGVAADGNSCTSAAAPCLTWHEINDHRWGCQGSASVCPRLQQNTTISFLSSHTSGADPVYFLPGLENASATIQCSAPTLVTSGVVLAGTTSKSRAAGSNSLLLTTLGATAAVGQLVINSTHASRAWVYKSLGANSFDVTQPLVASAVNGTTTPAEVDTWTNNDTVSLNNLCAINLALVRPTVSGGLGQVNLYQLQSLDPLAGTGVSTVTLDATSALIVVQESSFQRILSFVNAAGLQSSLTNSFYQTGLISQGPVFLAAGAIGPAAFASAESNTGVNDLSIDGDFIFGGTQATLTGLVAIGFAYLDQSLLFSTGSTLELANPAYGGHVLYGATGKALNLQGHTRMSNLSGTFAAALTAPGIVTGVVLNGNAAACSHSNANNPDVANCSITTTPAHLDAAQGVAGFGGLAYVPDGSSIGTHD